MALNLSIFPPSLSHFANFSLITFEPDQRNRLHTHPQISPAHCHHRHRCRRRRRHHHRHPFWKSENSFARWLFLLIKLCAFVIIFLNCCILFCPRHWLTGLRIHTHTHTQRIGEMVGAYTSTLTTIASALLPTTCRVTFSERDLSFDSRTKLKADYFLSAEDGN